MQKVVVDKTEKGPHKGWTFHYFKYRGIPMVLRTIEDERPHSFIRMAPHPFKEVPGGVAQWLVSSIDGILTPQAALDILLKVDRIHERGYNKGYNTAKDEIQKALSSRM